MGDIYLREEQRADYEEYFDYNIDIEIINRCKIVIGDNYVYRRDFKEGDVVTNDNTNFGYVYYTDEKEVKVCWGYGVNEWENKIDLLIIPCEYGFDALNSTIKKFGEMCLDIEQWIKVINGFSFQSDQLLFNESNLSKVEFIKYQEDGSLYDEKIDREITLYKEIGKYNVFKTKTFRGDILIVLNTFYILDIESKDVYYGGYGDEIRETLSNLYKINGKSLK